MSLQGQDARWQRVFILALVVGVLHMLLYAWWTPPWQFPDEPRHYEYVRLIGELGRPPEWNDTDPALDAAIIRSMARFDFWRFGFAVGGYVQHRDQTFAEIWTPGYKNVHFHPPLYYGLMAWLTDFVPLQRMVTHLLLLRLLSVLIGTFSLLLIGLTGVALAGWREGVTLLVFAALIPGHVTINASVNNDVLVEFFGVFTVLAGVVLIRRGIRPLPVGLLLAGLILTVLTKRSGVFLIVYVLLALGTGIWFHHLRRRAWRWLPLGLALVCLVLILASVLAWRLGRVDLVLSPLKQLRSPEFLRSRFAVVDWEENLTVLFQSFWARLGWLNIFLPPWVYRVLLLATGVAALGWVAIIWETLRRSASDRSFWLAIGLTFFIPMTVQLGITLAKQLLYVGTIAQGRYLYPFFPAYALFYMHGWEVWLRRVHARALTVIVLFLGGLALLTLWTAVQFYYGAG